MDGFCFSGLRSCRTLERLDRRIGQRRDATRAPIQARNGWRPSGRLLVTPPHHLKDGQILSNLWGPPQSRWHEVSAGCACDVGASIASRTSQRCPGRHSGLLAVHLRHIKQRLRSSAGAGSLFWKSASNASKPSNKIGKFGSVDRPCVIRHLHEILETIDRSRLPQPIKELKTCFTADRCGRLLKRTTGAHHPKSPVDRRFHPIHSRSGFLAFRYSTGFVPP